jgi:hypothetical protein
VNVEPRAILEALGPARRFADPAAPKSARLLAAGGALPLPPGELAMVVFALTLDAETDVAERANGTLRALPDRVIDIALQSPVHPALLDFCAEAFGANEARLEKIALNPATADETFARLARLPYPRLIDICAGNQTRLLRAPALVEALSENLAISQGTIDRVLEFLGLQASGLETETPEAAPAVPEPAPGTADAEASPFDAHDLSTLPEELIETLEPAQDEREAEDRTQSLLALVQKMSVMEKIKLARVGNTDARGLLVRDRNKMVAQAAIRSPKLTETEVITYAKSRQVCDDVLRIISFSREWTKNYQVKLAISTNPKAPVGQAIKFLNYLTDRDLRSIMRSRDVPAQISAQARRILSKKGKV